MEYCNELVHPQLFYHNMSIEIPESLKIKRWELLLILTAAVLMFLKVKIPFLDFFFGMLAGRAVFKFLEARKAYQEWETSFKRSATYTLLFSFASRSSLILEDLVASKSLSQKHSDTLDDLTQEYEEFVLDTMGDCSGLPEEMRALLKPR